MRFETAPGEQAQMDWGSLAYTGEDGKRHRIWVVVMTLGCPRLATWSWSGERILQPSSSATSTPSSIWVVFPANASTTTPRW